MSNYIVRKAIPEDMEACIIMGADFIKESSYATDELDYDTLIMIFIKSLQDGLAFVAEDDGDIFGMLLGHKGALLFNKNILIAQEIVWWVDVDYRHTRAGGELIRTFESEAKKDCKYTVMSLLPTSPAELKQYFNHIGYIEKEFSYFKENF